MSKKAIQTFLVLILAATHVSAFGGTYSTVVSGVIYTSDGLTRWGVGDVPDQGLDPMFRCTDAIRCKVEFGIGPTADLVLARHSCGSETTYWGCVSDANFAFGGTRTHAGNSKMSVVLSTDMGKRVLSVFNTTSDIPKCSFEISKPTIDAGNRTQSQKKLTVDVNTITAKCTDRVSVYVRVAQNSDKDISVKINGHLNGSGMNLNNSENLIPVQLSTALAGKNPGKYEHIIVIAMTIN